MRPSGRECSQTLIFLKREETSTINKERMSRESILPYAIVVSNHLQNERSCKTIYYSVTSLSVSCVLLFNLIFSRAFHRDILTAVYYNMVIRRFNAFIFFDMCTSVEEIADNS